MTEHTRQTSADAVFPDTDSRAWGLAKPGKQVESQVEEKRDDEARRIPKPRRMRSEPGSDCGQTPDVQEQVNGPPADDDARNRKTPKHPVQSAHRHYLQARTHQLERNS